MKSLENKLSEKSLEKLQDCHFLLIILAKRSSLKIDIEIFCTYRNEFNQNYAYSAKLSKLKYPQSAHNKKPTMAFDAYPNPLNWRDIKRFKKMGKIIKNEFLKVCKEYSVKGIELIWGGDFKSIKDYVHFELKIKDENEYKKSVVKCNHDLN